MSDEKPATRHSLHRVAFAACMAALLLFILLPSFNATAAEIQEQPVPAVSSDSEEVQRRLYATLGFGLDFSRGDYGEPDTTNSGSIPATLKLEWEPITFRISVPFLAINGSDNVIGGTDGPISSDGGDAPTGSRSFRYGIGDVVTSLTYTYYPSAPGVPIFDFITKVKIPTASSTLGTGKTDVTLQLEAYKGFGRASVFGGFGYRFKGGGSYEDILLASGGVGFRVAGGIQAGLAYDWRESALRTGGSSHELSPYMSFRIGEHVRFGPYAVIGLSEQAPDWGVGTSLSYEF